MDELIAKLYPKRDQDDEIKVRCYAILECTCDMGYPHCMYVVAPLSDLSMQISHPVHFVCAVGPHLSAHICSG